MFMGAIKLEQLYLSENRIERVEPSSINRLPLLVELWLDGNRLTTLDSRLEKSFQRLRYGPINLENNPFSCDCSLVWLANWLRQHASESNVSVPGITVSYPQCFSPPIHHFKFINTIDLPEFQCGNATYTPVKCSRKIMSNAVIHQQNVFDDDECFALQSDVCETLNASTVFRNEMQISTSNGEIVDSCLCNTSITECYVCPAGWYGNHSSDIKKMDCKQCQVLTGSSFGSRHENDCQCLPGFYTDPSNYFLLSSCTGCPVNYYKSMLGPQMCTPCSEGAITKTPGATICECLPGFQLQTINEFSSTCEPCPNGTFKAHSGHHKCQLCPDYSLSLAGSTSNKQCDCLYGTLELGSLSSPHRKCRPPSFSQINHLSHAKVPDYQNNNMEVLTIILLSIALLTVIALLAVVATQRILRHKNKTQERISEAKKAQIVQICIPQPVEDAWIQTNISSWAIPRENVKLCKVLGQGAFGQVYEAIMDKDGLSTKVAVKCCRESTLATEEQDALWSELKLLIYVGKHPNIVNLIGTCFQQSSLMLVLEYAEIGDLLTLLRTKCGIHKLETSTTVVTTPTTTTPVPTDSPECQLRKLSPKRNLLNTNMIPNILYSYSSPQPADQLATINRSEPDSPTETTISNKTMETIASSTGNDISKLIDERALLSMAWQITKGMEHLEQLKCIHRDLAARNILISEGMIAKISDFGLAREAYESGYYFRQSKGRLPFKWMAPEALLQGHCTNKSDVWSFGIVLWEMMTLGATPYPGVPLNSLMDLLLSGYRMPKPDACRDDIFDVMQACWRETPSERPAFRDLCFRMDYIMQTAADQHYISIESDDCDDSM
ncbi:hypothetical protein CHUAL_002297 [Chamberlinius hualienensis]